MFEVKEQRERVLGFIQVQVNGKRRDVVYVKGRLQHGAKITVRLL